MRRSWNLPSDHDRQAYRRKIDRFLEAQQETLNGIQRSRPSINSEHSTSSELNEAYSPSQNQQASPYNHLPAHSTTHHTRQSSTHHRQLQERPPRQSSTHHTHQSSTHHTQQSSTHHTQQLSTHRTQQSSTHHRQLQEQPPQQSSAHSHGLHPPKIATQWRNDRPLSQISNTPKPHPFAIQPRSFIHRIIVPLHRFIIHHRAHRAVLRAQAKLRRNFTVTGYVHVPGPDLAMSTRLWRQMRAHHRRVVEKEFPFYYRSALFLCGCAVGVLFCDFFETQRRRLNEKGKRTIVPTINNNRLH
jgi:hypothetical protein